MPVCGHTTRPHRLPSGRLAARATVSSSEEAAGRLFFDPRGEGVARHAAYAADATHTGAFLIRAEHCFPTFRAITRRLWGQHPGSATVFTAILLTAAPIMPVFHNVLTAAFPAVMLKSCRDHRPIIRYDLFSCKKIDLSFTR